MFKNKSEFSIGDKFKVVFGKRHSGYNGGAVEDAVVVRIGTDNWIGVELEGSKYRHISLFEDEGWEDVEFLKEKKQPFFSIKEGSIESAARFIVANNNYQPYANINECEESIKRCISRMVERIKRGVEAYRCSTAGWTVLIGLEDEDYYVVEVLVDSSVSQDREFVNVEEIV